MKPTNEQKTMNEHQKLALIMHLAQCEGCRAKAQQGFERCRVPSRLARLALRRATS